MTRILVEIFGQKRTVQVWNYVSIMLGVGFVGGPPIGQWFTTQIVGEYKNFCRTKISQKYHDFVVKTFF